MENKWKILRISSETKEGDVVLIATAGAYGRSMSSHYNLREPAAEIILEISEEEKQK